MGIPPSSELLAASRKLGFLPRLRAEGCVRWGRAAPDAASARYAVALAHATQRQWSRFSALRKVVSVVGFAALVAAAVAGAVALHSTAGRVASAAAVAYLAPAWVFFLMRLRNAAAAEQANRAVLAQEGSAYIAPGEDTPAELSPWFVGSSAVAQGASIWAAVSFGPSLVSGDATAGHAGPFYGLFFTGTYMTCSWVDNRWQRRSPNPPPGPSEPYQP